jgi:hypothetical protein
MAQPTPYNRLYDFSDYQEVNPTKPLRGSEVDAEFDALKLTTDQLRANAALIQRDDGKLANQAVTPESLSAGALAMIHQGEYVPRGAWLAARVYALGDLVDFNAATYLCVAAHTSVTQFANDLAAGRWLLIANGALTGQSTAVDLFEGTGSQTVFTLGFNYAGNNAAQVFVAGVAQIPAQDFTISGTTLTFVVAPPAPSVAGRSNVMVRGSGVEAQLAADAATTQAANAAASAAAASASESAAAASQSATATSATNAADSATAAAGSATTATNQATTATTQATNAAGSATSAAGSASTATTQAANASASATAAAGSATTATNQATTATNQATAAAGSATAAATSATNAAASATSASGSASTATTQASNASGSATAAAGSASAASTSASNASSSAATAQLWAAKMDGPVAGGEFSAKYWAGEAASIVTAGVIDDAATNTIKTWSSSKISTELGTKLSLTGGTVTGDTTFNGVLVGRGEGNVASNTTVGNIALQSNTTGAQNFAGGRQAMRFNTTGSSNTAVGNESLVTNTTGSSNTAVGSGALYTANGIGNTAVGQQAGVAISTGSNNTIFGNNALYNNATGENNSAVGAHALFNATGTQNVAVGYFSGSQVTTGNKNTILGSFSGNQGGLDIRTANNHVVLSDGDGNPRLAFDDIGNAVLRGNLATVNQAETLTNKTLTAPVITQNIQVISGNTTAVRSRTYVFTATLTLTLPASPTAGDTVSYANRSDTDTCVIARNGQNIMGVAEDMTVDNVNYFATLVFADATRGWVFQ